MGIEDVLAYTVEVLGIGRKKVSYRNNSIIIIFVSCYKLTLFSLLKQGKVVLWFPSFLSYIPLEWLSTVGVLLSSLKHGHPARCVRIHICMHRVLLPTWPCLPWPDDLCVVECMVRIREWKRNSMLEERKKDKSRISKHQGFCRSHSDTSHLETRAANPACSMAVQPFPAAWGAVGSRQLRAETESSESLSLLWGLPKGKGSLCTSEKAFPCFQLFQVLVHKPSSVLHWKDLNYTGQPMWGIYSLL